VPILAANETFAQFLQAALPQSSTQSNALTIVAGPSTLPDTVIPAVSGLTNVTQPITITLDLGGGTYSIGNLVYNPTDSSNAQNVTFIIEDGTLQGSLTIQGGNVQLKNVTFDPNSPALTVAGGQVLVTGCKLTTTGNAPTLLVTGGSVTLLNDAITQASTVYPEPAIAVTGGTVNLGTATTPGNNTLSVNSSGNLVTNTSGKPISAVGDTFVVGGTVETAPNLSFTTLASSAATAILNQVVTLTATVQANGSSIAPTGSVDFFDMTTNTDLGRVSLSGGVATLTTSTLPLGTQVIVAKYIGDATYLPSANTVTESVHYSFSGFLPPLSNGLTFASNRIIPIKFTLTDYNGKAITSLGAVTSLQIQALDANGNPVGSPFNPTGAGGNGLSNTGGQYVFNWQTKGLVAGSYQIVLTLADGTANTRTLKLVANGSGSNAQAADGSDVSGSTAGQLLGGNVELYVDNSNGNLTADELARIQDAVNAVDATTAPYGVAINEVTDPTQADVTLSMDTTSAVGGYAQGILGCYTTTGTITLIQGWTWYAGADPTQIGANQYDFQTTVTHELGHALGLGEGSVTTSAMYGTLAPATAIRTLTTADLNIPYAEGSADAQRAALPPAGVIVAAASSPSTMVASSTTTSFTGSTSAVAAAMPASMDTAIHATAPVPPVAAPLDLALVAGSSLTQTSVGSRDLVFAALGTDYLPGGSNGLSGNTRVTGPLASTVAGTTPAQLFGLTAGQPSQVLFGAWRLKDDGALGRFDSPVIPRTSAGPADSAPAVDPGLGRQTSAHPPSILLADEPVSRTAQETSTAAVDSTAAQLLGDACLEADHAEDQAAVSRGISVLSLAQRFRLAAAVVGAMLLLPCSRRAQPGQRRRSVGLRAS
jgi:hypothetical protein